MSVILGFTSLQNILHQCFKIRLPISPIYHNRHTFIMPSQPDICQRRQWSIVFRLSSCPVRQDRYERLEQFWYNWQVIFNNPSWWPDYILYVKGQAVKVKYCIICHELCGGEDIHVDAGKSKSIFEIHLLVSKTLLLISKCCLEARQ